jgi:hypothetical protein
MRVDSVTVGPVIQPLANVNVSIGMDETAVARSLVGFEITFVATAIHPDVLAHSFANLCTRNPFSLVDRAVVQMDLAPFLQVLVEGIHEFLAQELVSMLDLKVPKSAANLFDNRIFEV